LHQQNIALSLTDDSDGYASEAKMNGAPPGVGPDGDEIGRLARGAGEDHLPRVPVTERHSKTRLPFAIRGEDCREIPLSPVSCDLSET
jgi:hypothetical protein